MKRIFAIAALVIFIAGCGSLHVEKRRSLKGFHISWNKKVKSPKATADETKLLAVQEESKSATNRGRVKTIEVSSIKASELGLEDDSDLLVVQQNETEVSEKLNSSRKKKDISQSPPIAIKSFRAINTKKEQVSKKEEKKKSSGYLYFLTLLAAPALYFQKRRARKVSKWASENKTNSRVLFTLLTFVGIASSFALGNILQLNISKAMIFVPLVVGAGALALAKSGGNKESKYIKDRLAVVAISFSTYFGTFALGATAQSILATSAEGATDPLLMHPALVVLLTILLIALLMGAVIGIAILACGIACNGYGIAAVALLVGGTYIVFFLIALALFALFRRESTAEERFGKKAALTALIGLVAIALITLLFAVI